MNISLLLICLAIICSLSCLVYIFIIIIKDTKKARKVRHITVESEEDEYYGADIFAFEMARNSGSKRMQSVFDDLNIHSPSQLKDLTIKDLKALKGCGPVTIDEIKKLCDSFSVKLK